MAGLFRLIKSLWRADYEPEAAEAAAGPGGASPAVTAEEQPSHADAGFDTTFAGVQRYNVSGILCCVNNSWVHRLLEDLGVFSALRSIPLKLRPHC